MDAADFAWFEPSEVFAAVGILACAIWHAILVRRERREQ